MPIINQCPYCQELMETTRMSCRGCGCSIEANFPATRLAQLPTEHQRFIEIFILAGGNLKQIAEQACVSYPTVRSRLDKVIDALRTAIAQTHETEGTKRDAARPSAESADDAARIIKAV